MPTDRLAPPREADADGRALALHTVLPGGLSDPARDGRRPVAGDKFAPAVTTAKATTGKITTKG